MLTDTLYSATNWLTPDPMFRDLVSHSPSCDDPFAMDLSEILPLVRTHDVQNPDSVHAMYPAGFVFHESRCGSTLAANSLAAMDPDKHRVYSESNPSITALKACGTHGSGCPPGRAAQLIRDVLYLMGRTDDVLERRLFFKIQSIGTKSIHVMREAFPDVPWVFIYREPVQVMMSQIANGVERANCVRQMRDLDPKSIALMKENGKSLSTLESEDKCALHLVRVKIWRLNFGTSFFSFSSSMILVVTISTRILYVKLH